MHFNEIPWLGNSADVYVISVFDGVSFYCKVSVSLRNSFWGPRWLSGLACYCCPMAMEPHQCSNCEFNPAHDGFISGGKWVVCQQPVDGTSLLPLGTTQSPPTTMLILSAYMKYSWVWRETIKQINKFCVYFQLLRLSFMLGMFRMIPQSPFKMPDIPD